MALVKKCGTLDWFRDPSGEILTHRIEPMTSTIKERVMRAAMSLPVPTGWSRRDKIIKKLQWIGVFSGKDFPQMALDEADQVVTEAITWMSPQTAIIYGLKYVEFQFQFSQGSAMALQPEGATVSH